MQEPTSARVCVLIVEDSAVFREFLRHGVERRFPEVEVREAGGVEEGYRIATECRPKAVFVDVGLPDGNGLDLVTRLRDEFPTSAIAVCTMHDIPEYRERARLCGADTFFPKQRMEWRNVEHFVYGALSGDPGPAVSRDANGAHDPLDSVGEAPST